MDSLRGKNALITGAGKRLGRATALALAAEGVNIIVHYNRSADEANELQRELFAGGVASWTVQADLEDPYEAEQLIERTLSVADTLDILVNNASIFPPDKLENITFDHLMANIRINAWAPFVLSREFASRIGTGKIVNMLDSRIVGYDWTHASYILSKHLLAVLTRMTALQYAPDITVNAVAPGLILPPDGQDESYLDRLAHTVPLKRHGSPEDVARAIVYLLKNDFLTGQVIYVDGGRHLKELTDG